MDRNKIREAVGDSEADGWLFFNFKNRDPIGNRLLDISPCHINSRPWFYIAMKKGENVKISHIIEPYALKHLEGKEYLYSSRKELEEILGHFSGLTLAVQFDPVLTNFSFLDHGTALFLIKSGINLVSSAALIQKTAGILNQKQIASHEEAGKNLYAIIASVWQKIRRAAETETKIYENDIQTFILGEFEKMNMITEGMPIVAAGKNSADPHYETSGKGDLIGKNEIVQLDIWAKKNEEGAVFGDISWVGFTGKNPGSGSKELFSSVAAARDLTVRKIAEAFASGKKISGAEADETAVTYLKKAGYGNMLRHRTGHGIDTMIHGSGVNLDSSEFPDRRFIEEGSCFSVEPGLYGEKYGMRSEINVYIKNGIPIVSGGSPQKGLMTF